MPDGTHHSQSRLTVGLLVRSPPDCQQLRAASLDLRDAALVYMACAPHHPKMARPTSIVASAPHRAKGCFRRIQIGNIAALRSAAAFTHFSNLLLFFHIDSR